MTRKQGDIAAFALVSEVATALASQAALLCQPVISEEDGIWTLEVTFRPTSEMQGLQVLELASTLRRVQDMAQLRGLSAKYGIAPAKIEALMTPQFDAAHDEYDMLEVESSNVAAIGWAPRTDHTGNSNVGVLRVRFNNGALWEYQNVERARFDEFLAAPSKGQFFAARIKQRQEYPSKRLEASNANRD